MARGIPVYSLANCSLRILLAVGLLPCLLASVAVAAGEVEAYPLPPGDARSAVCSVRVGDQDVDVVAYGDVHYAHFGFCGQVDVSLGAAEPVTSCVVSPLSLGLQPVVQDGRAHLPLDRPCKLVVRLNDRHTLLLLADPIDPDAPRPGQPGVRTLADFAPAGVERVQTQAIQAAIDAVAAQDGGRGGVLYVPAGRYLTGTLQLRSGVTVYLAPGARIQGTSDPRDYPLDPGRTEEGINGREMTFSRLILFDGVENARLAGRGTIDGDGRLLRQRGRAANLVRIRNSRGVSVEGVVLRAPAAWNTHILHSEDVTVRNAKILNDLRNANGDGIDPDASRNVLVEDCLLYCSDDCIAVKSTDNGGLLQDVENVRVRGCVMWGLKGAMKVGTETRARTMRGIVFEDCDVVRADRPMYLVLADGATVEDCTWRDIRVEEVGGGHAERLVLLEIRERHGRGRVQRVRFENCSLLRPAPQGSEILGLSEEHRFEDVRFVNLRIAGRLCRTAAEAGFGRVRHADVRFDVEE